MTSTEMASPGPGAAGPDGNSTLPNAWRIEVFRRDGVDDPEGVHAKAALTELGLQGIESVRLGRGYLLPPDLDEAARLRATKEFLVDPVVDSARVTAPGAQPEAAPGSHRVLVARKPGVMDPVAQTLEDALRADGLLSEERPGGVSTFRAWEITFEQAAPAHDIDGAARAALANEVIEAISPASSCTVPVDTQQQQTIEVLDGGYRAQEAKDGNMLRPSRRNLKGRGSVKKHASSDQPTTFQP